MRRHGLFPFTRFYEWVERSGKPTLISFAPESHEIMWAPCLWDTWTSADDSISFSSFAILTDDPPPEIQEKGHDRCPIFLSENMIDNWLAPETMNKNSIMALLKNIERTHFTYAWAA